MTNSGCSRFELAHGIGEDAGAGAAGAVGDDGELKSVGIVGEIEMGPGVCLFDGDPGVGVIG